MRQASFSTSFKFKVSSWGKGRGLTRREVRKGEWAGRTEPNFGKKQGVFGLFRPIIAGAGAPDCPPKLTKFMISQNSCHVKQRFDVLADK